jgi:hypothetical protein
MTLVEWLISILDEDQCVAEAAHLAPWKWNYEDDLNGDVPPWAELKSGDDTVIACEGQLVMFGTADAEHIALHDPAAVLADIAAKRAIIVEVQSWKHARNEEDCWYSCAQAKDECGDWHCCDDGRAGSACDCGLDSRKRKILGPLASAYAHRDGFDPSWV